MIDVIKKIHWDKWCPTGEFVEVTVESIENQAILLGNSSSDRRTVIYKEEVDNLIEALQELKEYL